MKKGIFLFFLTACMLNVGAQEKKAKGEGGKVNISAVVKDAFASKYSKATHVKWGIEKPGQYEVEFIVNKVKMAVLFDTNGNLLETESKINESSLPTNIKSTLSKDFKNYKVCNIDKNIVKGSVTYELDVKKGKNELELVFDSSSKLLKREIKEDNKD